MCDAGDVVSKIIRDIQLMGLVALLILVDMLVLTAWYLADPVRCSRSVGALVKVPFNSGFMGQKSWSLNRIMKNTILVSLP